MWTAVIFVAIIILIFGVIDVLEKKKNIAISDMEDISNELVSTMNEEDVSMVVEDLDNHDGEHTARFLRNRVTGVRELQDRVVDSEYHISLLWLAIGVVVFIWFLW